MPTVGRVLRNTGENHYHYWFNLSFEISRWADLMILPIAITVYYLLKTRLEDVWRPLKAGLIVGLFAGGYIGAQIGIVPMLIFLVILSTLSGLATKSDLAEVLEKGIGGVSGLVIGVFAGAGFFSGLLPGVILTICSFVFPVIAYVVACMTKAWLIKMFTPIRVNRKIRKT